MSARKTGIRIIYILIVFGMLLGCMSMNRLTVWAYETDNQDRFTIVCSPVGDTERYVYSTFENYPIAVTVRNNGEDFEGTIKLLMYMGSEVDDTIAWGRSATIKAGASEVFYFYIENITSGMDDYKMPLRIDFLDQNGDVVSRQASEIWISTGEKASFSVGIVSENPDIKALTNHTVIEYSGYYDNDETITMRGISLNPNRILKYDLMSLKLIILDRAVSEDSWQELSEWVLHGGYILINNTVYSSCMEKELDENQKTSWGSGTVLVYDGEISWNEAEFETLIMQVLKSKELLKIQGIISDPNWVAVNTLNYDMWTKVPNIPIYGVLLVAYIVLIGPIMYGLLSKKRRREYLWAIIPCFAVLFSGIIYIMGNSNRYKQPFVRYEAAVQITEEGNIEKNWFLVTNPNKTPAVITMDDTSDIKPCNTNYYGEMMRDFDEAQHKLMDADYNLAIIPMEDSTDILVSGRGLFDEQYFRGSNFHENEGGFVTDIRYRNGQFEGSITNRTSWDMKDMFVINQGILMFAGELRSGETMELKDYPLRTLPQYYILSQYDQKRCIKEFEVSSYGADINEAALEAILTNYMVYLRDQTESDSMLVGGFTEDYDIGIYDNSRIQSVKGLTMVYEMVHIDNRASWPLLYGKGLRADNESQYSRENYGIYSTEPVDLIYDLGDIGTPQYLKWVNVSKVLIELYNYETGEYDIAFEAQTELQGDILKAYVDKENQIKARVIGQDDRYEDVYVPAFTVTGGGRND